MTRSPSAASAPGRAIARAARELGARSVAFTYNDPVVFLEYAVDVAKACREADIRSVAVTAGYVTEEPRRELYGHMDAANVDLKGFTNDFYRKLCGADLAPVLDTLAWLHHESDVWVEITTLLIPGQNDSDTELTELARWVAREMGPEVPLHFTAFHPDFKMMDLPPTPPETLTRARRIALDEGLHHVYTGNVHDRDGGLTRCARCQEVLIRRDWYQILEYRLTESGACPSCGTALAGRFGGYAKPFGPRRIPVAIHGHPA